VSSARLLDFLVFDEEGAEAARKGSLARRPSDERSPGERAAARKWMLEQDSRQVAHRWVEMLWPSVEQKLGVKILPTPLGTGWNGQVFATKDGRVVKITGNAEEAEGMRRAKADAPQLVPRIDDVAVVARIPESAFAILREEILPLTREEQFFLGHQLPKHTRSAAGRGLTVIPESVHFGWANAAQQPDFEQAAVRWMNDIAFAIHHYSSKAMKGQQARKVRKLVTEYVAWARLAVQDALPELRGLYQRVFDWILPARNVAMGFDVDRATDVFVIADAGLQNIGRTGSGRYVLFDFGYMSAKIV